MLVVLLLNHCCLNACKCSYALEQILQCGDKQNGGPFIQGHEDWVSYAERLKEYFAANDIDAAAKQRVILLNSCGAETYQLIRNLVVPHKPADKSFKQLVDLVQAHYCPPPSVIVQRLAFNNRAQCKGETVAKFVAELWKLSEECQFGASLDKMLRD